MTNEDPRQLIAQLCAQFYQLGWCTGTGGGISIRQHDRVFMAPSGVQKERIKPEDIFVLDLDGEVLEPPATQGLRLSACAPLFYSAFRQRDAGAVIHSHSVDAVMTTLHHREVFRVSHVEMIKGIRDHGYADTVEVPIIPNTAHECDLTDSLSAAIDAWPASDAVLVERHGVYVWGADWRQAKTQAECYDYLFRYANQLKVAGLPTVPVSLGE
ncbi:MAG: methylthioribulose 1-phosphate dehydratase [Myxococcota bacterium]|nr:methylthioribulose 1-phosphate dehydratase [Myxococcota bacterium]